MQTAGQPAALVLLRLQGVRAGLASLGLQPDDHLVEGSFEHADLAGAVDRDALSTEEDVCVLHSLGQPFERTKQPSEQEPVHGEHDKERHEQVGEVDQGRVLAQRTRREGEHECTCDQDGRVGGEHAPEQGHRTPLGRFGCQPSVAAVPERRGRGTLRLR